MTAIYPGVTFSTEEGELSTTTGVFGSVDVMSELVERVDEQDRVLGIIDRGEAIRSRLLHRVATVVCRDVEGRILVHRRPGNVSRFPGQYNWLLGGAVDAGETYEDAAARELAEELGVRAPVRFAFKFLCHGVISPYWLGLHEAVIAENVAPNPSEIAWHDWLPEATLREVLYQWPFVPDCQDAFTKYTTLPVRPPSDPAQADLPGQTIPRTWSPGE